MDELLKIAALLSLGGALLYFGAEGLVSGGVRLATRYGLTPLAIGLTIIAFGTSCPELAVTVRAATSNSEGIALGNIIGSNISNIALIIGICAIIRPIKVTTQIVRIDIPVMIIISLIASLMIFKGKLLRVEGLGFCLALVIYTVFNYIYAKKNHVNLTPKTLKTVPLWKNLFLIIGGLILLILGATTFVRGAVITAQLLGFSETVIGLTIVALGTSLPELATSIVASLRNESDIALGNIVGSNVFNLLGILGITASITPLSTGEISAIDLGVMLLTAIALLPIARTGLTITRWEGGLLLAIWCGYMYYLMG